MLRSSFTSSILGTSPTQGNLPVGGDRVVGKLGAKRTDGSVYDFYQVTRLIGGSQNSSVNICQRKAKKGQWSSDRQFRKRNCRAEGQEFLMKCLRINTLDCDYTQESQQAFFDQLDKVTELRHPNIVRVSACEKQLINCLTRNSHSPCFFASQMYEYFERYGKVYMIMEFCDGGNLASRLPLSEYDAIRIISALLSAVKHIHTSGMFHLSRKYPFVSTNEVHDQIFNVFA